MSNNTVTPDEIATAENALHDAFDVNLTVTTLVKHVTRSGLSRSILVLRGDSGGAVTDLSWAVARVLGWKFDGENGGVKVQGTGMDMGAHLVYTLSMRLYGDGYELSQNRL